MAGPSSLVVVVVGTTGVLPENGYLAAATAHKAAATGTLPEDGYLAAVAERLWQWQQLPGAASPLPQASAIEALDGHVAWIFDLGIGIFAF